MRVCDRERETSDDDGHDKEKRRKCLCGRNRKREGGEKERDGEIEGLCFSLINNMFYYQNKCFSFYVKLKVLVYFIL